MKKIMQLKIVIPYWVVISSMILSFLQVNYGLVYFFLIVLGMNQFPAENTHDGKSYAIPASWPGWLKKTANVWFWIFTVLAVILAYIENHPEFKTWLFSKLP